jgi:hypothetical protein
LSDHYFCDEITNLITGIKNIKHMKRMVLFLIAGFFAISLTAQTQPEAAKPENPNAPEITFEKTVHDYGSVPYNGDGKTMFSFTNTGKEPLILTNVRSSCGCTVPKWPREPILPGQSEVIHVEYKTNRIGRINKSVTVQSNAKNGNVVLRIEGQVLRPEESTPPTNAKPMGTK